MDENEVQEDTTKRKREDSDELPEAKKRKLTEDEQAQSEEQNESSTKIKDFVPKTQFENSDQQLEHYLGTKPHRTYPFLLDDFQVESIWHLQNNRHVLVSAHTSAGKTVVAEYAIAKSIAEGARVIYTSPIKALSNQKFREFQEEFQDVGLMTGDVYKNPGANILVMTTEILRNMLYRGSELLSEVSHVVFDEVHYMRDASRGVVWEESIILLDEKIRMVFLSATLSNANDFAEWVEHTKGQPCPIVATSFRPVPLKHYLYPPTGSGLFLVKEGEGHFLADNFLRARQSGGDSGASDRRDEPRENRQKGALARLLLLLQEQDQLPAVVFAFARLGVEALCLEVFEKNVSFVTDEERENIGRVYDNAMETLLPEDRELDVVKSMRAMLLSGLGCHHSGLIPILKEVTELLFQEGLIKVLFATETFAMGVNMPAKTVIFAQMEKWDGKQMRLLNAGEYTQMSGRAGRRHVDDTGTCIMLLNDKLTAENCAEMIAMKSAPLTSSFRLTYNMLLNLKRVDVTNVKEVIEKSFYRFLVNRQVRKYENDFKGIQARLRNVSDRENYKKEDKYFMLDSMIDEKVSKLFGDDNSIALALLVPGRLVWVAVNQDEGLNFGWGVLVAAKKRYSPNTYFLDVLTKTQHRQEESVVIPKPGTDRLSVIRVDMTCASKFSPVVLSMDRNLNKEQAMEACWEKAAEIRAKILKEGLDDDYEILDGFPVLDPLTHYSKFRGRNTVSPRLLEKTKDVVENIRKMQAGKDLEMIHNLPSSQKAELKQQYKIKEEASQQLKALKQSIRDSQANKFVKELKAKSSVLRHMGYMNKNGTLTKKAMVACCLDSADEIVLTEMLFHDSFKDLAPKEIPAFLSCFLELRKPKGDPAPVKNEKLVRAYGSLRVKVHEFIDVQKEYGLEIDDDEYMERFQPFLMDPLVAWCEGKKFADVVKMCNMFEGQLIRNTRRVEDIMRQMIDAVKAIGNSELIESMKKSLVLLRHGLAFSTSLYVGNDEEEEEEYGYIPEQFIDEHFKDGFELDEQLDAFLEENADAVDDETPAGETADGSGALKEINEAENTVTLDAVDGALDAMLNENADVGMTECNENEEAALDEFLKSNAD